MPTENWIHVVAAVIENDKRQLLIAKRPDDKHQGGLWEFPGGKVEENEEPVEALIRELKEELDISVNSVDHAIQPFLKIRHRYPDKSILLDVYHVHYIGSASDNQGGIETKKAIGNEGQEIQWVSLDDLSEYEFPQANQKVLKSLRSPVRVSILEEGFVAQELSKDYFPYLIKNRIDTILLRTPLLKDDAYIELYNTTQLFISRSPELQHIKVVANRPALLSKFTACDGLHLNSQKLNEMQGQLKSTDKNILVSASCHNTSELELAENLACDFVFISPLKKTHSHPEANPLGWQEFTRLIESTNLPVLGLGGLCPDDLDQVKLCGGFGVAGISHFGA